MGEARGLRLLRAIFAADQRTDRRSACSQGDDTDRNGHEQHFGVVGCRHLLRLSRLIGGAIGRAYESQRCQNCQDRDEHRLPGVEHSRSRARWAPVEIGQQSRLLQKHDLTAKSAETALCTSDHLMFHGVLSNTPGVTPDESSCADGPGQPPGR